MFPAIPLPSWFLQVRTFRKASCAEKREYHLLRGMASEKGEHQCFMKIFCTYT